MANVPKCLDSNNMSIKLLLSFFLVLGVAHASLDNNKKEKKKKTRSMNKSIHSIEFHRDSGPTKCLLLALRDYVIVCRRDMIIL